MAGSGTCDEWRDGSHEVGTGLGSEAGGWEAGGYCQNIGIVGYMYSLRPIVSLVGRQVVWSGASLYVGNLVCTQVGGSSYVVPMVATQGLVCAMYILYARACARG